MFCKTFLKSLFYIKVAEPNIAIQNKVSSANPNFLEYMHHDERNKPIRHIKTPADGHIRPREKNNGIAYVANLNFLKVIRWALSLISGILLVSRHTKLVSKNPTHMSIE